MDSNNPLIEPIPLEFTLERPFVLVIAVWLPRQGLMPLNEYLDSLGLGTGQFMIGDRRSDKTIISQSSWAKKRLDWG